jgi:hypothetical protein
MQEVENGRNGQNTNYDKQVIKQTKTIPFIFEITLWSFFASVFIRKAVSELI